jgi:1,4-dihydroxy-2-naphthoyl-CoA hydrolase
MSFTHTRTVRFQETDAAGVVYFANVLTMCHEACEESLAASGINLKSFFTNPSVAIPIVHASVDFFRPMFCGDQLLIKLITKQLSSNEYEIAYQIFPVAVDKVVAKAITRHVCIDPTSRTRKDLPAEVVEWLEQWDELKER